MSDTPKEFTIKWLIQVTADTPEEAAEKAHEYMLDPDEANCMNVHSFKDDKFIKSFDMNHAEE